MTLGQLGEYSAVALNVVGSVYVARRDRRGYAIFIAGFLPSLVFALYYRHWGMLALYIYYFAVNCYGYWNWRRYGDR